MGDRGVFCLIIISLEEFCEIKQHQSCDVNIFCASEEFVGTKQFSEVY